MKSALYQEIDPMDPISCGAVKMTEKGRAQEPLRKIFNKGEELMDAQGEKDAKTGKPVGMPNEDRAKKGQEVC